MFGAQPELTCVSCRHVWMGGEVRRCGYFVRDLYLCKLTRCYAERRCEKFEYEPGSDEKVVSDDF